MSPLTYIGGNAITQRSTMHVLTLSTRTPQAPLAVAYTPTAYQLDTLALSDLLAVRSVLTYACPDWPLDTERVILSALLAVEDAIDRQNFIPASLPVDGEPSADEVTRCRRVLAILALEAM